MKAWLSVVIASLFILTACTATNDSSDETLRIAFMTDLSSPASLYGNAGLIGARTAIEELESQGAQIELLVEDNKNNPSEAVKAYQRLRLENPDVVFSTFSGATVATAPLALEDGLPFVSTIAFANVQEYENAYQYFSTPEDQAEALVAFLQQEGITKVMLTAQAIEAGEIALQEAEAALTNAGIEVVLLERHAPSATDLRTEMLKANELGAQAVYAFNLNAAGVAESMKNHFDGVIIWAETPVPSRVYETASELEDTYSTAPLHAIPGSAANDRFVAVFGEERLAFHAAYTYDLVKILWLAKDNPFPEGIQEIGVFPGIAGDVNLSVSRRPRFPASVVYISNFTATSAMN